MLRLTTRSGAILGICIMQILFGGCTANMAGYMEALGKDPANACISISTPYGGGVIGRVNTPGAKMNISGGQCTIDVSPKTGSQ